jgi:hypothetical protein
VRGPAGHAGARKERGEERRRDVGDVEDDGRPELDIRCEDTVRMASGELLQRGLFERLGDLDARRLELARRPAQDAGARILGAVDAMPEAHDALTPVEEVADVLRDVVGVRHLVEHLENARRGPAMERARESADGRRHRRRAVRAGRGHDAAREGRGVRAVLGCRDPVGVDGARMTRVGLPPPAEEEALGRGVPGRNDVVGDTVRAAGRLGDDRDHRRREAREVVPRLGVLHVDELLQAPLARERGGCGLEIRHRAAGLCRQVDVLRAGHPGVEAVVDEEAPDLLVRHVADELFDVHPAVPERAALLVGLGNLGLEGDDALEARLEVASFHRGERYRTLSVSRPQIPSPPRPWLIA